MVMNFWHCPHLYVPVIPQAGLCEIAFFPGPFTFHQSSALSCLSITVITMSFLASYELAHRVPKASLRASQLGPSVQSPWSICSLTFQ